MSDLQIPGWDLLRRGRVREVYASADRVLLVASDRLTDSGVVLPEPIPGKGEWLTSLSAFWFQRLDFVPNHFLTCDFAAFPAELKPFAAEWSGRAMLCRRARPLPVECVVRGYLAGEAWEEYRARGTAGGHDLPRGLREASKLPRPLFVPTTKTAGGSVETVTWEQCRGLLGDELAHQIREASLEIYDHARARAERAGVIIAETRLVFGLSGDELLLIDECLTPDTSLFWPAAAWEPGATAPSFDKQFVHDWLRHSGWNGQAPAPHLPPDVIARTAAKYRETYERLALGRRPA